MEKIAKEEFQLIGLGLAKKTSNEARQSSIDCGNLWEKFEKEGFVQRIPGLVSNAVYAVYFDYDGDHSKLFYYFIGCKVEPGTRVPEDMQSLIIPSQNYSRVIARGKMPDCLTESWSKIWTSQIDRAYQFDFEIYDDRSHDWDDAEVEIFVSSN
ncbi:MAG TPA: effector binding domain-containing protein [Daejeonella sp.]|nr:effector binding domain-containing protein [Daejeonella sp.]